MAVDPRIRAELERRGPANVRELLRTRTGPGDRDPVALQLNGVPDPPRSDVEDWLREGEREGEAVARATLKWAKIAGQVTVIGVIVTAVAGIVGIIIGMRSCSYSSSTYNEQHRPLVRFHNLGLQQTDNGILFVWDVWNDGNEDATEVRLQFEGINLTTGRAVLLKAETPSSWQRLTVGRKDEVKIKINISEFPYLMRCVNYRSDRVEFFPPEQAFYALSSLQAPMTLPDAPWPNRSEYDQLAAKFSCTKL